MKHWLALFCHRRTQGKQFWALTFQHRCCLSSPREELSFLINCTIPTMLHQAYRFTQRYISDLIPAWSSCSLHLSDLSGNSCGLVKTRSPSQDCRALQCHFHPSEGPYWGSTEIYPPSATPLTKLHLLHWSSSPLGKAHGTDRSTLSSSVSAFVCDGNLECESKVKRRVWFWWSHVWLWSASLCFSQYICWQQEHPLTRPQWRREHRNRRTIHSCTGSSCPHPSCRWDRRHCWRCRRWCQWCCSDLKTGRMREVEMKGQMLKGKMNEERRALM